MTKPYDPRADYENSCALATTAMRERFERECRGRRVLERVPLGAVELVVSVDDRDRLEVHLWTATGGVTITIADLQKLLEVLHALERGKAEA